MDPPGWSPGRGGGVSETHSDLTKLYQKLLHRHGMFVATRREHSPPTQIRIAHRRANAADVGKSPRRRTLAATTACWGRRWAPAVQKYATRVSPFDIKVVHEVQTASPPPLSLILCGPKRFHAGFQRCLCRKVGGILKLEPWVTVSWRQSHKQEVVTRPLFTDPRGGGAPCACSAGTP